MDRRHESRIKQERRPGFWIFAQADDIRANALWTRLQSEYGSRKTVTSVRKKLKCLFAVDIMVKQECEYFKKISRLLERNTHVCRKPLVLNDPRHVFNFRDSEHGNYKYGWSALVGDSFWSRKGVYRNTPGPEVLLYAKKFLNSALLEHEGIGSKIRIDMEETEDQQLFEMKNWGIWFAHFMLHILKMRNWSDELESMRKRLMKKLLNCTN